MSNRSQSNARSSRPDVEANRSNREPYAVLWLDNQEICLYEEDEAPVSRELPLN